MSRADHDPAAPLAGIHVIDLAQFVAGSYCTQMLGDLGADVLKIELPGAGDPYRGQGPEFVDGQATLFLALNRNKRSVCIDWKRPEGFALLDQLLTRADVVVQNARSGALDRYGLGARQLTERHARLVYCAISGYGQTGPGAERGGFDLILQAEGGLMSVTGEPDRPPVKVGVPLLDVGAALAAVAGIAAALVRRVSTGRGGVVETSLLDFSLALFGTAAQSFFATGIEPTRRGSASPHFAPYQAFAVGGEYLVVAGAGNERLWRKLCDVVGRPDLATDPRFRDNASRVEHQGDLAGILSDALSARTRDQWLAAFADAGIPAGPINGLAAVFSDEQVQARGAVVPAPSGDPRLRGIAAPVRFDGGAQPARSAPALGADTTAALEELGLARREIDALRASGAIA